MRSVTATEAKNQFGQVIESALTAPVTITKTGRKLAVLMSWAEYERLQALEDAAWGQRAAEAEAEGYLGAAATRKYLRSRLRRAK